MTEAFGDPTPKQNEFLMAKTRFVGYGGAKGGGKSHIVRTKATLLCEEYPGIKILVIRKKNKDLKRNYIRPLQSQLTAFPEEERPKFNVQDMIMTFPNTSFIEFGFCDSDADADDYRGNEWDVLILDEATELSEYQIKQLITVVRGVNKLPKRIYITFNPGGVGHAEIKRMFIDRQFERSERPQDYTFIPARIWHNTPLLMSDHGCKIAWTNYRKGHKGAKLTEEIAKKLIYQSDYVRGLDSLPEVLREAYINGNMDIFFGQYFSNYNEEVHECEPFPIPSHWKRTAAIDYGLDMFAAVWMAVDERGNVYCYRNVERMDMTLTDAGKLFYDLSKDSEGKQENIEHYVIPHDMLNRSQDTGIPKIHTFAASCPYPYIEAGRDRESGWLQLKEYLRYESKKSDTNELIVTKKPKLQIFNTCKPLTTYIPLLQNDPKKPTDVMTEPHRITHSPDALRYWGSTWQTGMVIPEKKKVYHFKSQRPKPTMFGEAEVNEDYLTGGY